MSVNEIAEKIARNLFAEGLFKFAVQEGNAISPAATGADEYIQYNPYFKGLSLIGIGYDDTEDQNKIITYATRVSKKVAMTFPKEIDGARSILRPLGNIDINPHNSLSARNRGNCYTQNSKICCGSSSAPASAKYSGTFGAVVSDGTKFYALSNNHVYGECNHTKIGHPILCPSANDVGNGIPHPQSLFTHSAFTPLYSGEPNQVSPSELDASIAEIIDVNKISTFQGNFYDTPTTICRTFCGQRVKKVGRTTGLTQGVIDSKLAFVLPLNYKTDNFKATVYFKNVWFIRSSDDEPFGAPGDSGSLVVTEDGSYAVGLLFACSTQGFSVMMPLTEVLSFFGVQLVNGL